MGESLPVVRVIFFDLGPHALAQLFNVAEKDGYLLRRKSIPNARINLTHLRLFDYLNVQLRCRQEWPGGVTASHPG